ncbi:MULTISPECIES: hypothetical protein [unclassified Caballeronia]|uniref:hypothetical protein n=1 Tax=unclassified Caballeronia TaxID=2646786 RepID=UPI001F20ECAD|nr:MULTISPECIES: hypothetical protein [unclassified Caballeronia]MCE4541393.1 hypothetical protein [Caballeronia sp. PC1]MCE4569563.1 hypothetical protein [Caballeronia sp. CLC5]
MAKYIGKNDGRSGEEIARDMVRKLEETLARGKSEAEIGPPRPLERERAEAGARWDKEMSLIADRLADMAALQRIQDIFMSDVKRRIRRLLEYGQKE